MEWVWPLYEGYVRKKLSRSGVTAPSDDQLETTFLETLGISTVTVLVQEPWQNSVRFKGLGRYEGQEMLKVIYDPERFLLEQFGGGKFKLNFHEGWNFVATRNFKPDGPPKWVDLPEINF